MFGLAKPLPAGAKIESAVGGMPRLRLHRPAWLFWEDLGHGVLFPHPGRLLLLDAADSRVIVNRWMTAFPLVNLHPPALAVSTAAYLGARGAVYDRRPFRRVTLVRAPSAFAASRA